MCALSCTPLPILARAFPRLRRRQRNGRHSGEARSPSMLRWRRLTLRSFCVKKVVSLARSRKGGSTLLCRLFEYSRTRHYEIWRPHADHGDCHDRSKQHYHSHVGGFGARHCSRARVPAHDFAREFFQGPSSCTVLSRRPRPMVRGKSGLIRKLVWSTPQLRGTHRPRQRLCLASPDTASSSVASECQP